MKIPHGDHVDTEQGILSRFDSFCKTVVRNERRNVDRAQGRREKRQARLNHGIETTAQIDQHSSDGSIVKAGQFHCTLRNECLWRAMNSLPESRRGAVIAQFWYGWNDNEIASHYGIVTRTVRKWRTASFRDIRMHFERGHTNEANRRNDSRGDERESPGT